jgi:hypothetical protein
MPDNTSTNVATHLTRTQIWADEIKEILRDELMATRYVRMLDFPDGDTLNIPSMGQAQVDDYVAGDTAQYRPMATGNFTFTIDNYKSSGLTIREDQMEDSYYAETLLSRFVPEETRAIMVSWETDVLGSAEDGISANSREKVDSLPHRWSGGDAGEILLEDFAAAKFALDKAKVPDLGRVAIVDPSVEYRVNNFSQITTNENPMFEGIINTGIATGMRFIRNVYGFDVYVSNYLPEATDSALQEATAATTNDFSSTAGKTNLFFSTFEAPFVGSWKRMPKVDYEFEQDEQLHKYLTTARWGVKLWRPENMVRVITKPAVFAADA